MVMKNYDEKSRPIHILPPWVSHNPLNPRELMSRRIPPNSKCPCGSGKKFKKCCSYMAPLVDEPKIVVEKPAEQVEHHGNMA
jgi:hypothetical protein